MTRLDFSIETAFDNAFGWFVTGRFLEETLPPMATDQKFKLGQFEFEIWGMPQSDIWTLKLVTEGVVNEVWDEQIVRLELL